MRTKISICIPTLNRGKYIGETLNSIVCQLEDGVDVVIVDGGSIDDTENVVKHYQGKYPVIRYYKSQKLEKQPSNQGFDRDCDRAIELARGEYCWIMTDDDLFLPGAIKRILEEVKKEYALIIVNTETRSNDLSRLITKKRPDINSDLIYTSQDFNKFAELVLNHLTFAGAVIIKKSIWMSVDRKKYYGTGFIHIGVIFDRLIMNNILVMSTPLIAIRWGNAMWANSSTRAFRIWMLSWPELIWSFASLNDKTKESVCLKEPWRNPRILLSYRIKGYYSRLEYDLILKERLEKCNHKLISFIISIIPISILKILISLKRVLKGII